VLRPAGQQLSLFAAKFREAAGRALLASEAPARPSRHPFGSSANVHLICSRVAAQFLYLPDVAGKRIRECIRDVFELAGPLQIFWRQFNAARFALRMWSRDKTFAIRRVAAVFLTLLITFTKATLRWRNDARAGALGRSIAAGKNCWATAICANCWTLAALDEVGRRGCNRWRPEISRAAITDGVHDLLLKLGRPFPNPKIVARKRNARKIAATISELVKRAGARCAHVSAAIRGTSQWSNASRLSRRGGHAHCRQDSPKCFSPRVRDPFARNFCVAMPAHTAHSPRQTVAAPRYGLSPRCGGDKRCTLCMDWGKLLEGEFRPGRARIASGAIRKVLQQIRPLKFGHGCGAKLNQSSKKTFLRGWRARWQGVTVRRRGLDALLDTVENLQGAGAAGLGTRAGDSAGPHRRVIATSDLDTVMASGQVVWVGVEQVGDRDGTRWRCI